MFTVQKIKLFFSDPQFRKVQCWDRQQGWNEDAQQEAVNKIFAGQKQLRRSKVVKQTNHRQPKHSEYSNQGQQCLSVTMDFLQSRIQAYEKSLIDNIQKTAVEKDGIKDKYTKAQSLYLKAKKKLQKLTATTDEPLAIAQNLLLLQKQIEEIKQLYEQNSFLKSMNDAIRKRIEQKQLVANDK